MGDSIIFKADKIPWDCFLTVFLVGECDTFIKLCDKMELHKHKHKQALGCLVTDLGILVRCCVRRQVEKWSLESFTPGWKRTNMRKKWYVFLSISMPRSFALRSQYKGSGTYFRTLVSYYLIINSNLTQFTPHTVSFSNWWTNILADHTLRSFW